MTPPLRDTVLMMPTTLQKITQQLCGRSAGSPNSNVLGHSIDSRTLNPGDVFWALPGRNCDGHQFVTAAFEKGAAAAVVSQPVTREAGPCIQVEDVAAALAEASFEHRNSLEALMIGLTGSVGKTTTRQMLHAVLSKAYTGTASRENFNNRLGVPLSLLGISEADEYAVIEMGASAQGEIGALGELVQPEIAMLTQIAPAHLDGFGSIEGVISGKSELFDNLPESGLAVLPEHLYVMPAIRRRIHSRVLTVGQGPSADICLNNIRLDSGQLKFECDGDSFRMNAPGKHFASSAGLCVAIARELGLTTAQIQTGLESFSPVEGRCCRRMIGDWTVLDDTYNASPISMSAGLVSLLQTPVSGPRIAILGDMLCLGEHAKYYHRKLGQEVARSGIDYLLVYGEFADHVAAAATRGGMSASRIAAFLELEQLQELLPLWLSPGAGMLLKASRNMQLERLIPVLKAEAGSATQPLRRAG